ncbi:hypothetical protein PEX2_074300 [Penicillium expansum]|uniref:C2H2-type domain-containing protein n=1 Tax=Penicillium expansum TaxID=27334 RepID=A0A0A2K4S5_PENEN|nr:hypothetical protein PEX2_074300 [Penicillium expansum]KGO59450.1 hypothetical protein PEX2_074300 [Penicillium expansum]
MAPNIATVLNDCLKEFTESTNSGALTRYENEVSKHRWLDELGRLRVWAGNIGAHQTGQSSLDYRLRDASHLKDETVKLLQRLLRLLRDLADVIEDENQVEDENDAIFFEDSELELEDNDMTDIQMLFQSLRNTINLLFQMSMAIRRPADHDRLLGVKIKDESYFELWAQKHISHKFPNAKNSIIPRLSAAMARQKAVLKYFARHRAKLEGWPSDIDYVPPGAMAPKLPPSSFSQIKGTPDSFSVFSWAKSWEKNFGTCQHFPQRAVGNANPEGLGHSPNSKSQAHENFPWESGEKANEYSSHSFGIDGDTRDQESTILGASNTWTTHAEHLNVTSNEDPHDGMLVNLLSLNAFDGRQVKLPGTTSHGNDQTDDLEGGSSSLDGKKKACDNSESHRDTFIGHLQGVHDVPRPFLCPVQECGKAHDRMANMTEHLFRVHNIKKKNGTSGQLESHKAGS